MIHVFHGFLGSPLDFSFLKTFNDVIIHDLYAENLDKIDIDAKDTLIGYSMGGRIALELASKIKFNLKKLVLINAHPGLPDQGLIGTRSIWEESVLDRLKTLSPQEFLSYWNSLPLFEADLPLLELSVEKQSKSLELFKKHRLSKQHCFLPELKAHKDQILWIAGEKDLKYAEIARMLIAPLDIHCRFIEGGHRLYQTPQKLIDALKEENIL